MVLVTACNGQGTPIGTVRSREAKFFEIPNMAKGQDLDETYQVAKIKSNVINQMPVTLGIRPMTAQAPRPSAQVLLCTSVTHGKPN